MLHRMKLRVLYGDPLSRDRSARRLKLRVILLSGIAVFIPFLIITYYIFSETRAVRLVIIGILAAHACVPVVLYAYAKGYGRPLAELWKERPEEMKSLSLKIGFFYGFTLYWMILGIVEFLFGYHSFRAALISFVASAAARDGFEIGYFRAQEEKTGKDPNRTIFPDGKPIGPFLKSHSSLAFLWISIAIAVGGAAGAMAGPLLPNPKAQIALVGAVGGIMATLGYAFAFPGRPAFRALVRFLIWPGFIMAATYFFISAYFLRILFQVPLSPAADLGFLTALCSGWIMKDSLFIGYLKADLGSRISDRGVNTLISTGIRHPTSSSSKRLDL